MKKYFTNLFLGTVHENLRSSFLYLQPVNSKNVGFYDEGASPIKDVTLSREKRLRFNVVCTSNEFRKITTLHSITTYEYMPTPYSSKSDRCSNAVLLR